MKRKTKPKFRVGQVVAENCEPPKYGRIDIVERNDDWSGGFRYHFAGDPDYAPIKAGGHVIGTSGGMLRPLTARERGERRK